MLVDKTIITDIFNTRGVISAQSCWLHSILLNRFSYNDVLVVTGTLTPDATGYYIKAGLLGGFSYFVRTDGEWFIWCDGEGAAWYISNVLGNTLYYAWESDNIVLIDYYHPYEQCFGTAYVDNVLKDNVIIYDGVSVKGIIKFKLVRTYLKDLLLSFKEPILFSNGCYIDSDVFTTKCLINYQLLEKRTV